MDSAVVEQLRSAVLAYEYGDTGPLVALLHDDLDWRGPRRGVLWWKHAPESHGRAEAREVLAFQWLKQRDAGMRVERTDYEEVADKLVASSQLCDGYGGHRRELFHVLTFRDGRIIRVQTCRTRREAVRAARADA